MKRIVIPTFEKIEWMPPTITMFQKLNELGYEIVYITLYPDDYFKSHPLEKVRNVALRPREISLQKKLPYIKGISGVLFRLDNTIKKIVAKKLKRAIKKEMTPDSILWVVNEMTPLFAGSSFLKKYDYIFTIYELHTKCFKNRNIIKAAKMAKAIVVPEFCRANIMKVWYDLEKVPFVLPNKSDVPLDISVSDKANEAISKMEKAHIAGKKLVVYMGNINQERPLEPILDAFKQMSDYKLAVIGRSSPYLETLFSKYNDEILYLGGFTPPEHLEVAKHGDIGLLIYVPLSQAQGLNVLFCAPNKIFEYTGVGMPVIANDMPALRYDIMTNKMGKIADFDDTSDVLKQLKSIDENLDFYKENAKDFYESVNVTEILENVLTYFKNSL